jgi:hypothetical protein
MTLGGVELRNASKLRTIIDNDVIVVSNIRDVLAAVDDGHVLGLRRVIAAIRRSPEIVIPDKGKGGGSDVVIVVRP